MLRFSSESRTSGFYSVISNRTGGETRPQAKAIRFDSFARKPAAYLPLYGVGRYHRTAYLPEFVHVGIQRCTRRVPAEPNLICR